MPKYSIIFILFALFFVQCYRADKNCLPPCEKLADNFYFHNDNKYVLKSRDFFGRLVDDREADDADYTYHSLPDTNLVFYIGHFISKKKIYLTWKDTTNFSRYVLNLGYKHTMFRKIHYEMEGNDSIFVAESNNFGKFSGKEDGRHDSLYYFYYRREKLIGSNRKYVLIYTVSRDTAFDVRPYRAEALAIWDCIEVRE